MKSNKKKQTRVHARHPTANPFESHPTSFIPNNGDVFPCLKHGIMPAFITHQPGRAGENPRRAQRKEVAHRPIYMSCCKLCFVYPTWRGENPATLLFQMEPHGGHRVQGFLFIGTFQQVPREGSRARGIGRNRTCCGSQ